MGRDLRLYATQTTMRLIAGFILLLFIIGDGLILLFYGKAAALMGLVCLVGAAIPLALIVAALWGIDWVVKRNHSGG